MSTTSRGSLYAGVLTMGCVLQRLLTCCLLLLSLSACSTMSSADRVTVDRNRSIALLPFENLSATPLADTRLQRLVETRLRHRGVRNIQLYESAQRVALKTLLNGESRLKDATSRAKAKGARYGVTGTVHEWQYKGGADREPVVGVTLSIIDFSTDSVLWQANAARSGWGAANLSAIADKVVGDLLEQVTFSDNKRDASLLRSERSH
ncbi:MAG: hypothetical protein AB8B97_19595 [Granulosicoccus sp.]